METTYTWKNEARLCHWFGLINTLIALQKSTAIVENLFNNAVQSVHNFIVLSGNFFSVSYESERSPTNARWVSQVRRTLERTQLVPDSWIEPKPQWPDYFQTYSKNSHHYHHFKNYMLFRSKPLTETCQVLVKVLPVPWIPTVVTCPRTTFLPEPLVKNQFPNSGVTSITSKMPFHLGISVKSPMELSAFGV